MSINHLKRMKKSPGLFSKNVVTLNGRVSVKRDRQGHFIPCKVQVLDLDGEVEVIVESLECNVRSNQKSLIEKQKAPC